MNTPESPIVAIPPDITVHRTEEGVSIKIQGLWVASVFWAVSKYSEINGARTVCKELYGYGGDHEYTQKFAEALLVAAKIARIHPTKPEQIQLFYRRTPDAPQRGESLKL